MPIYEYKCEACGHEIESIQKISDPELKDCPECGKPQLKKLVSAAGFRLKGGGWYETDFKGKNRKNIVEGGEQSATDTAVKAGTTNTTETKNSDAKSGTSKASVSKESTTKDSTATSSAPATVEKSTSNKPTDISK